MKKYIVDILKLPRSIKIFLATQLLLGIAGGIWNVNFNFLLSSKGIHAAGIGSIASAGPFATAMLALLAGYFCDFLSFKRSLLLGCIIKAFAMFLLSSAGSPTLLYVAAALNGAGEAFVAVSQYPYITSLADKKSKNTVYSLLFSSIMFSLFVGNVTASALGKMNITLVSSFVLSGVLIAAAAVCRALLPNVKVEKQQRTKLYIPKDKLSRRYLIMEFFGYGGYFMANSMLNLVLRDHMGYSAETAGLIIGAMTLAGAATFVTPMLASKFGVVKVNGAISIILPFIYCGMALLTKGNFIFLAVVASFLNCVSGAVVGGPVLHRIKEHEKGGFSGLMLLIINIATSAGVFAAGKLIGSASGQSALYFSVALLFAVVAGIFMFGIRKELKEN